MRTLKNIQATCLQAGRSMIEMLGVLAIIGVLSIGALTGFKLAMDKHKANETLHDVMLRATNVPMIDENYASRTAPYEWTFSGLAEDGKAGTYYVLKTEASDLDNKAYRVVVSDVPSGVCHQMLRVEPTGIDAIYINGVESSESECPTSLNQMAFYFKKASSSADTPLPKDVCKDVTPSTSCAIDEDVTDTQGCTTVTKIACEDLTPECDMGTGYCSKITACLAKMVEAGYGESIYLTVSGKTIKFNAQLQITRDMDFTGCHLDLNSFYIAEGVLVQADNVTVHGQFTNMGTAQVKDLTVETDKMAMRNAGILEARDIKVTTTNSVAITNENMMHARNIYAETTDSTQPAFSNQSIVEASGDVICKANGSPLVNKMTIEAKTVSAISENGNYALTNDGSVVANKVIGQTGMARGYGILNASRAIGITAPEIYYCPRNFPSNLYSSTPQCLPGCTCTD